LLTSPSRRFIAGRGAEKNFTDLAGVELVRWNFDDGGTLVQFTEMARGEPFLKMALFGAVLIEEAMGN
jgi:hypothetical protein